MDAKKRQVLIEIFDPGAPPDHVHHQFAIPAGTIVHVKSPHPLKRRAAEKRRLLQPGGSPVEIPIQRKTGCPDAANALAPGIDDKAVAHHDVAIGVLLEGLADASHRSRQQHIVGVQKPENVAGGVLKPLVQAIGCSLVGFKNNVRQPAAKAFDQFPASVRRARVHHDVFDRRVILLPAPR